jgi:peroxiredoxin
MFVFAVAVDRADAQEIGTGYAAPDFTLPDPQGRTHTLAEYRGRPVVIHFAATWCPFCNAEAPYLETLYRTYRDQDVQVLIIDVKEEKAVVEQTARKFGFTFPVLLDADGAVARSYAPSADVLPDLARDEVMIASNLVIDRAGRIRFFSVLDTRQFDAKLVALRAVLDQVVTAP